MQNKDDKFTSISITIDLIPNICMQSGTHRIKCKSQSKHHFNTHTTQQLHQLLKQYELPLFQNGWSIYLQLLILDAMELFGCQNWEMISQYLCSYFNSEDIRDHCYRIYASNHDSQFMFRNDNMLINNDDDNIYIAASNKQKYRIQKEQRQKKTKNQKQQDNQYLSENYRISHKLIKPNNKKIPIQFGYQQCKNIFAQPFNQQAQIMILGLNISKTDNQQLKQSKMHILRQYNRLVLERRVVQKQIMQNKLMQCKYSLTSSDMIIKIPQKIPSDKNPTQRKSKKKNELLKYQEQKKKQNLFFKICRKKFHYQLYQPFHVVYMKIIKFDQNQILKNLLIKFYQQSQQIKYLQSQINQNI